MTCTSYGSSAPATVVRTRDTTRPPCAGTSWSTWSSYAASATSWPACAHNNTQTVSTGLIVPVPWIAVQVLELWRFPVKSLGGERVDEALVAEQGLEGDRRFAIFDLETGFGLTARRTPELLYASACIRDGDVEITLPDGSIAYGDDALSKWLGRPVELRSTTQQEQRSYENPDDFEHEDTSNWTAFNGARGAFHDSTRTRVSLVSTGTLGAWDRRRFRANVLLAGEGEDALVGRRVRLGSAELDVVKHITRCVMVTRPQPGGIGRDTGVLKTVHRERGGTLAVGALVVQPGPVAVGDELRP